MMIRHLLLAIPAAYVPGAAAEASLRPERSDEDRAAILMDPVSPWIGRRP